LVPTAISGESSNQIVGEKSALIILDRLIKPTIEAMGIKFDSFFREKTDKDKLEVRCEVLSREKNLAFEERCVMV